MAIKNIVAVTGKYKKDWVEKNQYTTIGKLIEKDDWNVSVKIDTIPVNRDWRANVYEKTEKATTSKKQDNDEEDDLPF